VPAGDEESDRRVLERSIIRQQVRPDMPHKVVHRVDRFVERDSESLGSTDADHERARQARPTRHRDRVDVGKGDIRYSQCLLEGGNKRLEVGARGDLRNYAAVAGVLVHR
jgi:hypothetical protein